MTILFWQHCLEFRSYLLALDNGASCLNSRDVASQLGQDAGRFSTKYDGGTFTDRLKCDRMEVSF